MEGRRSSRSYAPLEGPDTAGPTLLCLERKTLLLAKEQAGRTQGSTLRYSVSHNTALLVHKFCLVPSSPSSGSPAEKETNLRGVCINVARLRSQKSSAAGS